jgi:hypothetical protein
MKMEVERHPQNPRHPLFGRWIGRKLATGGTRFDGTCYYQCSGGAFIATLSG